MSETEDNELKQIMELQAAGKSEEEIANILAMKEQQLEAMKPYDPKHVFKEEPPKPALFSKSRTKNKPFSPVFTLNSSRRFTLNGHERLVKKLNLRDNFRIISKLPKWANYMGFNVPEMLVDEFTGKYRIADTLMVLLERAFGDYDYELDRPTDFSESVLEEVAYLLNITDTDDYAAVDYLLSCDPDEVYEAVAALVEYNQVFFTKLWNKTGIIRESVSLIRGTISQKIKTAKEKLKELEDKIETQSETPLS